MQPGCACMACGRRPSGQSSARFVVYHHFPACYPPSRQVLLDARVTATSHTSVPPCFLAYLTPCGSSSYESSCLTYEYSSDQLRVFLRIATATPHGVHGVESSYFCIARLPDYSCKFFVTLVARNWSCTQSHAVVG